MSVMGVWECVGVCGRGVSESWCLNVSVSISVSESVSARYNIRLIETVRWDICISCSVVRSSSVHGLG